VLAPNHSGGLTLGPDLVRDRFEVMADLLLHALAMVFAVGWEILRLGFTLSAVVLWPEFESL
jgi:hypothetical protein